MATRNDNDQNKAADEAARTARTVTDEAARVGEQTARAGADIANRGTEAARNAVEAGLNTDSDFPFNYSGSHVVRRLTLGPVRA